MSKFPLEIMFGCITQLCKKGCCSKLQQDWDGPYVIVKPLNDIVYRIQKPDGRFKVVHMDRPAPWNGDHDSDHGLDEDAQP